MGHGPPGPPPAVEFDRIDCTGESPDRFERAWEAVAPQEQRPGAIGSTPNVRAV